MLRRNRHESVNYRMQTTRRHNFVIYKEYFTLIQILGIHTIFATQRFSIPSVIVPLISSGTKLRL